MKQQPIVYPNNTLKDCMLVINEYAKRISFVLDEGVLVGVVTDGDIRRALLNNSKLDDPVHSIMNREFISFPIGTDSKSIRERFSKRIRHIPLVDHLGLLVDVADPGGNFRISVLEPSLKGNELNYVTECIQTNWISSQGKFVKHFEKAFEDFHQGTYALAVSNGTVALHLALMALGVGPGDEVIVPNLTFAASVNAIIHAGAIPVLCEIEMDTWCIDPYEVENLIGPKTKAIMPVHLYGQPCNMDLLKAICKKNKLLMIEDAAESLGSEWKRKKVGTFGDAATFSFFGNKTISTGEGGMVLFKDPKVAEKASILRDHGMSKNKRYWHDIVGYNYRLTNMQAAIGLAQMEKFDFILSKKLQVARIYDNELKDLSGVELLPHKVVNTLHSNWLYGVILSENYDRNYIINELISLGIETRPFFYPLNSMPPYKNYRVSTNTNKCLKISCQGLSLPSSVSLTRNDIISISSSLKKILMNSSQ